jgi:hypothetical protein
MSVTASSSHLHAATRQSCMQKHISDSHPTGCLRPPALFASAARGPVLHKSTVKADLQIALPPLTSLANHVSKTDLSQGSRSKLYINDTVSIFAIKSSKRVQEPLDFIDSQSGYHISTSTFDGGNCNIHAQRAYQPSAYATIASIQPLASCRHKFAIKDTSPLGRH